MKDKSLLIFFTCLLSLIIVFSCTDKKENLCDQGNKKAYQDFTEGRLVYTEYIAIGTPKIGYFDSLENKLIEHGIQYRQAALLHNDSIICYIEALNQHIRIKFGETFIDSIKQNLFQ